MDTGERASDWRGIQCGLRSGQGTAKHHKQGLLRKRARHTSQLQGWFAWANGRSHLESTKSHERPKINRTRCHWPGLVTHLEGCYRDKCMAVRESCAADKFVWEDRVRIVTDTRECLQPLTAGSKPSQRGAAFTGDHHRLAHVL